MVVFFLIHDIFVVFFCFLFLLFGNDIFKNNNNRQQRQKETAKNVRKKEKAHRNAGCLFRYYRQFWMDDVVFFREGKKRGGGVGKRVGGGSVCLFICLFVLVSFFFFFFFFFFSFGFRFWFKWPGLTDWEAEERHTRGPYFLQLISS